MTTDPAALRRRMIEAMMLAIDPSLAVIPKINLYKSHFDKIRSQAERALTAQAALLKELDMKILEREFVTGAFAASLKAIRPDDIQSDADLVDVVGADFDAAPPTPWEASDA